MLPKARAFWAIATAASFAFFLGFYILPSVIPWQLLMLYGVLLVFTITRFIKRYNWQEKTNDVHALALSSGSLSFMILFAILQELDESRAENTTGMSLVGLISALGLIWLWMHVKKRRVVSTVEPQAATTTPAQEINPCNHEEKYALTT